MFIPALSDRIFFYFICLVHLFLNVSCLYILLYMCAQESTWIYSCACVGMHVHVLMGVFLNHFPPYLFIVCHSMNLRFTDGIKYDWPVSTKNPPIFNPTSAGVTVSAVRLTFFTCAVATWTQVLITMRLVCILSTKPFL